MAMSVYPTCFGVRSGLQVKSGPQSVLTHFPSALPNTLGTGSGGIKTAGSVCHQRWLVYSWPSTLGPRAAAFELRLIDIDLHLSPAPIPDSRHQARNAFDKQQEKRLAVSYMSGAHAFQIMKKLGTGRWW